jgi:hypothetical protein
MIRILIVFCTLAVTGAWAAPADEISGTVTLAKGLEGTLNPNGALFIFAKPAGTAAGNGTPPAAVVRIATPKFPVKFSLGQKDQMMQGGSFQGPFTIYARYSPTGNATDKSGPQGTDTQHPSVKIGQSNVSIELKAK